MVFATLGSASIHQGSPESRSSRAYVHVYQYLCVCVCVWFVFFHIFDIFEIVSCNLGCPGIHYISKDGLELLFLLLRLQVSAVKSCQVKLFSLKGLIGITEV